MWTDRHRTRHETRLKDVVMQAGLDEVARFLERADCSRVRTPATCQSRRRRQQLIPLPLPIPAGSIS